VTVSGHSQLVDVSCQHLDVSGGLQVDGHSQLVDVSCQHLGVSGNLNVDGTLSGYGTIPIGCIVMWSGTIAPNGWAICDGTNGTPNLTGKFIVGLNTSITEFDTVGKNGGSLTISVDNLPSHGHSGTTNTGG
jgi:hypothetical protein